MPLQHWQPDNRTSAAVLPPLRAAQGVNWARTHNRGSQALRQPEGSTAYSHLHRGDWSFHLMKQEEIQAGMQANSRAQTGHFFPVQLKACKQFANSVKLEFKTEQYYSGREIEEKPSMISKQKTSMTGTARSQWALCWFGACWMTCAP